MKTKIALIVLLIISAISSMAQEERPREISDDERTKMFIDKLAKKIELSNDQKDSVTKVYTEFIDNLMKYRAGNNPKVITYLMKSRDDKVKNILRDDKKYDQYLLFLEEIKKQREPQQRPPEQKHHGGHHNPMGTGQGLQ